MSLKDAVYCFGGNDDFLVNQAGKSFFKEKTQHVNDPFSKEIIEATLGKDLSFEELLNKISTSIETYSFLGKKHIWIRNLNCLNTKELGPETQRKKRVEDLKKALQNTDPERVQVLITASPIDTKNALFKWLKEHSSFNFLAKDNEAHTLEEIAQAEIKNTDASIEANTLRFLIERVSSNTALLLNEIKKLSCAHKDSEQAISIKDIELNTPDIPHSDFFGATDAFFGNNIKHKLKTFQEFLLINPEIRPLIISFQNRIRLLIQLEGKKRTTSSTSRLTPKDEKNSFKVSTQNKWYLQRLSQAGSVQGLKKLINTQIDLGKSSIQGLQKGIEPINTLKELAIKNT